MAGRETGGATSLPAKAREMAVSVLSPAGGGAGLRGASPPFYIGLLPSPVPGSSPVTDQFVTPGVTDGGSWWERDSRLTSPHASKTTLTQLPLNGTHGLNPGGS